MEHMQKFEVLRMLEGNGECHRTMDFVEGTLLIYRVQEESVLDKNLVLGWIREIVRQLELYYQSGARQSYRYLNPYSILITDEEKILLLDMEAKSNEFVIRNMQKRSMRKHFVKPVVQWKEGAKQSADLYSLGKTIQFLLASVDVFPSFTAFEEYRLAKIIQKCLDSNLKNRYENLSQIRQELPKLKLQNRKQNQNRDPNRIRKMKKIKRMVSVVAMAVFCLVFGGLWIPGSRQESSAKAEEQQNMEAEDAEKKENETDKSADKTTDKTADKTADEATAEMKLDSEGIGEVQELRQLFLKNTKESNEKIIQEGERLTTEVLYYLAMAYDREERTEEAIRAYGILCQCQCEEGMLEQVFYRKAVLEQENEQLEQAKLTCTRGLELIPDSDKLALKAKELEAEEKEEKGAEEKNGEEPMEDKEASMDEEIS